MPKIKLTSVSSPFGGVGWKIDKSDKVVARDLITFLEDRRVIYNIRGHAALLISAPEYSYAVKSIMEIRNRIREDLERVKVKSVLRESMKKMQKACRTFLSKGEQSEPGDTYVEDLEILRKEFSDAMLNIGEKFGFSIESPDDFGEDEQVYRKLYSDQFFRSNSIRFVFSDEDH